MSYPLCTALNSIATRHATDLAQLSVDPVHPIIYNYLPGPALLGGWRLQQVGFVDEAGDVFYEHLDASEEPEWLVNMHMPDATRWLPADGWRDMVACGPANWALFFPQSSDTRSANQAKAICADCPVAAPCLAHHVIVNEQNGIYGGTGEDERRGLRRAFTSNPTAFADLCKSVTDDLAAGVRPVILRFRNTPGATCGKLSTKNRGCPKLLETGRACSACRGAGSAAGMRRQTKRTIDLFERYAELTGSMIPD